MNLSQDICQQSMSELSQRKRIMVCLLVDKTSLGTGVFFYFIRNAVNHKLKRKTSIGNRLSQILPYPADSLPYGKLAAAPGSAKPHQQPVIGRQDSAPLPNLL